MLHCQEVFVNNVGFRNETKSAANSANAVHSRSPEKFEGCSQRAAVLSALLCARRPEKTFFGIPKPLEAGGDPAPARSRLEHEYEGKRISIFHFSKTEHGRGDPPHKVPVNPA
jgi:hypothetical protein